jgi:hypothetical protein
VQLTGTSRLHQEIKAYFVAVKIFQRLYVLTEKVFMYHCQTVGFIPDPRFLVYLPNDRVFGSLAHLHRASHGVEIIRGGISRKKYAAVLNDYGACLVPKPVALLCKSAVYRHNYFSITVN